jgi:hypothetical protein
MAIVDRQMTTIGIRLPRGARIIDAAAFQTTFNQPGDTYTERLVMAVNRYDVQIIRYDCGDTGIVYIDGRAKSMKLSQVADYIERNTK